VRAPEDEDPSISLGPGESPGLRHPSQLLSDRGLHRDIPLQTATTIN
jgi:hypothetical protein